MTPWAKQLAILLVAAAAASAMLWWLQPETLSVGQLENINGLPFPASGHTNLITEKLAHADLYFARSPIARQAHIAVTFTPLKTQLLTLGIRENSFWLSYPWQTIYTANEASAEQRTVTITIPLTDKLPDTNNSLDLMFLAGPPAALQQPDERAQDTTLWLLQDLSVQTVPATPTLPQLKDAVRRLLTREPVK